MIAGRERQKVVDRVQQTLVGEIERVDEKEAGIGARQLLRRDLDLVGSLYEESWREPKRLRGTH